MDLRRHILHPNANGARGLHRVCAFSAGGDAPGRVRFPPERRHHQALPRSRGAAGHRYPHAGNRH